MVRLNTSCVCVVKGQRFCYPLCSQCSSETNAVWQFVLRRGTALLIIKLQTKSREHRQYQRGQRCKMNILTRWEIKSLLSCVWWSGGAQTLVHCSDSVWETKRDSSTDRGNAKNVLSTFACLKSTVPPHLLQSAVQEENWKHLPTACFHFSLCFYVHFSICPNINFTVNFTHLLIRCAVMIPSLHPTTYRLWCCLSGVLFHSTTLWKPIHYHRASF